MTELRGWSPVNGQNVLFNADETLVHAFKVWSYDHSEHGFGKLYLNDLISLSFQPEGTFKNAKESFSVRETRKALDLIRSTLYLLKRHPGKVLLLALPEMKNRIADHLPEEAIASKLIVKSMSDFVRESSALTLLQKAHQTLLNLYDLFEENPKKPLDSKYVSAEYVANVAYPVFRPIPVLTPTDFENGLVYGSNEDNGHFVIEYLFEKGYLRWKDGIRITASGFDLVDQLQRTGGPESKTVFVVRQYSHPCGEMLDKACEEAGKRLGMEIEPIWKQQHNEKIDDRIFRKIATSKAVIVDLTPRNLEPDRWNTFEESNDRINIGIEAGYALALAKPMILIRKKWAVGEPAWQKHRPFDISTMNIHDYDQENTPESLGALTSTLVSRIEFSISQKSTQSL